MSSEVETSLIVFRITVRDSSTPLGMTQDLFFLRIKPLHVIFHPGFERKLRRITERAPNLVQIGLGEILVMGVGIVDVIGLQFGAQTFVQDIDQIVERARLAAAQVINPALLRLELEDASIDNVFHLNEVALLFSLLENARSLS